MALAGEAKAARVTTTLDSALQELAFEKIRSAVEEAGAAWGMCLCADLATGDILCLAGVPAFDPESIETDAMLPVTHWARIEPGSVMKPLLMALALERGLIRPGTVIACRGEPGSKQWRVGPGRTITDDHYVGDVVVEDLLVQSSNIGAVRVGQLGGPDFHRELLALFELGRPPLLGLPLPSTQTGEPRGGDLPAADQFKSTYAVHTGPSLSFGYQLEIYPLTFAEAFATCVTGRQMRFRLIDRVVPADGQPIRLPGGPGRRLLSDSTVRWIRQTLARVVTDPHGTAHRIAGRGVDGIIGGKTGTSVNGRMGNMSKKSTASFCGFAPVAAPRFLAFAVVQKQHTKKFYGGQFAAPVVRDLLLYILGRRELSERQTRDVALLSAGPAEASGQSEGR
jgi:cell division protein FtsI (penicillin-binding protein 3)